MIGFTEMAKKMLNWKQEISINQLRVKHFKLLIFLVGYDSI
jgi:hypothetical protein